MLPPPQKNVTSTNADEGVEKLDYSCMAHVKPVWQFPKKQNMQLPYNPATALLGMYLREMKTYVDVTLAHKCLQWLC